MSQTQKSAEAGCLKLFKFAQLFFFSFLQCCKKSKVERT